MLNNKGQSLVLFILIIPILLGIMALVIDVGNALNRKNEIENTIEYVINYGLEKEIKEEKELKTLLNYNLDNCENTLRITENKIIVSTTAYVDGIFTKILNIKGFLIKSSYQGYLDGETKIIEKIK